MASSALSSRPRVVEAGRRALVPGGGVEHDGALGRPPQRPRRRVRRPLHRGAPFGRPVGVGDGNAEALGEAGNVLGRPLVAEGTDQGVVRIVGQLGRGQNEGQRLPDVVEVGRSGRPHVREEARGGEPARRGKGDGRARHQRRAPAGHQRVGVEQRHGEVADVRRLERVHLRHDRPDAGQAALAAQAGLRRAGGPRGEEEIAERLGCHRAVGHRPPAWPTHTRPRCRCPALVSSTSTRSLVRPTSPSASPMREPSTRGR